jgi:hypothetical protein
MDFLQKLLQGMGLIPAVVSSIEGLFGRHEGEQKKESAMAFVLAAMQIRELDGAREIVDEAGFKEGLSKMIDGAVECLNASCWGR